MSQFILSPAAQRDIFDIIEYIAKDNPRAALRLSDQFYQTFEKLSKTPGMGYYRSEIVSKEKHVRFWSIGNYLIIYREKEKSIEIIRVWSRYRDIRSILKSLN
ncbi:MAG: type II toxin-antitoxin system RelE/ParE family toxin [Candidatus Omnitrophota bacterium]|jgi:plasmid stabilization system protein ParE|nr:MAG: type II toxin-antitoxin system RelE/ParE family toxin [Candidatus Omnitrophota bacterium]